MVDADFKRAGNRNSSACAAPNAGPSQNAGFGLAIIPTSRPEALAPRAVLISYKLLAHFLLEGGLII